MISIAFISINIAILMQCLHGFPSAKTQPPRRPLEENNLFEGDIRFPPNARGVAKRGSTVRWPGGIVPYEIEASYGTTEVMTIIGAMRTLESLVAGNGIQCVQFRPRIPSDQYYIVIRNGTGCSAYVGQNTGSSIELKVTLQNPGCIYIGTIMHEFLHVLGFYHEQSRPDRDSYVQINYANILAGKEHNFNKYDYTIVDTLSLPYDYYSVMHYPSTAFSSNGFPTIVPLNPYAVIGQRDTLSRFDILEVQIFYQCTRPVFSPYSNILTTSSRIFQRPGAPLGNYYYQAIRLIPRKSGNYIFIGTSVFDSYGILYNSTFLPTNPMMNILTQDDNTGYHAQFKIEYALQQGVQYVLVFTTNTPNVIGSFSISGLGPGAIFYKCLAGCTNTITSTYSNSLTSISAQFMRPGGTTIGYFYIPVRVITTVTGTYTFTSSSTIDSYGILYTKSFSVLQPTANIIGQDDNSAGNSQFQLTVKLTANIQYVLVFTTSMQNVFGLFTIDSSGPNQVIFTS